MGRIIFAVALAGWAAITWIAWHLASARISQCVFSDIDCILRVTAQRDAVLVGGLVGGLLIILAALIFYARTRRQPNGSTRWAGSTNRAQVRELR